MICAVDVSFAPTAEEARRVADQDGYSNLKYLGTFRATFPGAGLVHLFSTLTVEEIIEQGWVKEDIPTPAPAPQPPTDGDPDA